MCSSCWGCKIGFLICYDNNLPENVRATTLLGAEIIFMPHVTAERAARHRDHAGPRGLLSGPCGDNRDNAIPCGCGFRSFKRPKGTRLAINALLLPARAYDGNGVQARCSATRVGVDGNTIKPGLKPWCSIRSEKCLAE